MPHLSRSIGSRRPPTSRHWPRPLESRARHRHTPAEAPSRTHQPRQALPSAPRASRSPIARQRNPNVFVLVIAGQLSDALEALQLPDPKVEPRELGQLSCSHTFALQRPKRHAAPHHSFQEAHEARTGQSARLDKLSQLGLEPIDVFVTVRLVDRRGQRAVTETRVFPKRLAGNRRRATDPARPLPAVERRPTDAKSDRLPWYRRTRRRLLIAARCETFRKIACDFGGWRD